MNSKQLYVNEEGAELTGMSSIEESFIIGDFIFLMTCTIATVFFSSITMWEEPFSRMKDPKIIFPRVNKQPVANTLRGQNMSEKRAV